MSARVDPNRLITRAVVTLLGGVVLLWVLYELRAVLLILYVSTLLAIGFSPAVRWLERLRKVRLPRWAAILILYFGAIGIVAFVLWLVIPPLARQIGQLSQDMPGLVDRLQRSLVRAGVIDERYTWGELVKKIESPGLAVASILGAVQTVVGVFGTVVTMLLLPYYLLVEAESLQRGFLHLFEPERRPRVARISRAVTVKVGAWLSGQLLLGFVIGTTASIGLWILGVPYFYVLGLIAAFGEMIPVIGPILSAIPAILMGWTVSWKTALFVAIYFSVQQFVENNVLVPRVMERQVGISAATVIVALLIGSQLLGVAGAILAVPTAAIVQVLLQEHLTREDS
jgi:predicted PurR-regulated permease PerM